MGSACSKITYRLIWLENVIAAISASSFVFLGTQEFSEAQGLFTAVLTGGVGWAGQYRATVLHT